MTPTRRRPQRSSGRRAGPSSVEHTEQSRGEIDCEPRHVLGGAVVGRRGWEAQEEGPAATAAVLGEQVVIAMVNGTVRQLVVADIERDHEATLSWSRTWRRGLGKARASTCRGAVVARLIRVRRPMDAAECPVSRLPSTTWTPRR
jgi:hypothetical protein